MSLNFPNDTPAKTAPVGGDLLMVADSADSNNAKKTSLAQMGIIPNFNAQTGTSYSLVEADANKVVTLSNASAITLTVPNNSDINIPLSSRIDIIQKGAGKVTVSPAAGVTIHSLSGNLSLNGQYAGATLMKESANVWYLIGNLTA